MMAPEKMAEIQEKARLIRRHIIQMTWKAQSGHPGGSLSLADIMAVLYFHELRYDPKEPKMMDRDRVILSKGHAAPGWYATLAEAGFFDVSELDSLRKMDALLEGHPSVHIPGVDLTTGSLGLGLSGGCGMALATRVKGKPDIRVYVILGDGELNEGQVWEAAMSAGHFKLDNLVAIVDRNRYQNDGATEGIMNTEPLAEKWKSFGWHTMTIDGHAHQQVVDAFDEARSEQSRPSVIIADTVKGMGVSYLIDRPELHYAAPTTEQKDSAMKDLDTNPQGG